MFQTLMPSQVYITLKIWINNKVTESPTIIVCHDKDCGQSASLQPSPITSKERRCLVNRLLKAAAACKVNRWVTGDNQPHHHEGKAVWKLETVRYHFTPHRWAKVPNLMMSSPAEDAVQQDHRCAEGSGELAPEVWLSRSLVWSKNLYLEKALRGCSGHLRRHQILRPLLLIKSYLTMVHGIFVTHLILCWFLES